MDFKRQYFNIWGEAYQLHKQFAGMAGADEEWGKLVQTSEEIMKKHEKEPQANFMKSLLLSIVVEIERVDRQRKEGAVDGNAKLELICKGDTGKAEGQT